MKNNSLAIVGLSEISQPFKSELEEFDQVWAINNAGAHYKFKPDRIVAMDDLGRDAPIYPEYVKAIVKAGCPVYGAKADKRWPSVQPFPTLKVAEFIGLGEDSCRVLDNSCCYALALGLYEKYERIALFGIDWSRPYHPAILESSPIYWKHRKHEKVPDWFKYYSEWAVQNRGHTEPGGDSFHFLLGIAYARGVKIVFANGTTLLNMDRDKFFYGYEEQPDA